MKKFVVAYLNFFDNELLQSIIEAETDKDALFKFLLDCSKEYKDSTIEWINNTLSFLNMDEIYNELFDTDTVMSVIEI